MRSAGPPAHFITHHRFDCPLDQVDDISHQWLSLATGEGMREAGGQPSGCCVPSEYLLTCRSATVLHEHSSV